MRSPKIDPTITSRVTGRPIATLLPLVIGGLIVAAVLPIILLGFIGAKDNTSRLLRDLQQQTLQSVVDHIRDALDPAETIASVIQSAVARGDIDPSIPQAPAFRNFMISSMAATPQITGIGLISSSQDVHIYNRNLRASYSTNGTLIPQLDRVLDTAMEFPDPQWLDITWSRVLREPILRLVAPLREPEGEFAGAIVIAIRISEFSEFLAQQTEQLETTTAFILSGQNRVLAHPLMINGNENVSPDNLLPTLEQLGDEVLSEIWESEQYELTALAELTEADGHWTWIGDQAQVYFYRPLSGYGPEGWVVGTHMPGEDTRRSRWTVNAIPIGGGILLLFAVLIAIRVGKNFAKPILALAAAARRIEAFDFDGVRDIGRGPIREVNIAADAFEKTAAGLKLFEAYVPTPVARDLMQSTNAAEPKEALGTVLFVDIAQFTTIAEHVPAGELVEMLNEYFDAVAGIISDHDGVITQFQGDAVLATYNLPAPLENHAESALKTARAIHELVQARTFAGQSLSIRVGVNTGHMVGGSVGARGRLNYTVHGDAVNLAARLEALNKEHGTSIMTTEETIEAAGRPADAVEVGTLRVRGRIKPVNLFAIQTAPDDLPEIK